MDAHGQAERRTLIRRLKFTAVALACSLAALIVATFFLAQQAQLVRDAMVRQTALTGWLGQFQRLLLLLGDAESGQRGYLLTEREGYLTVYRHALQELPQVLHDLDTVPIEDPVLSRCVIDIRKQTALKLAELAETIQLHDTASREAALALVRTDAGQRYMDELRANVNTVATIVRAKRGALNDRVVSGGLATEDLAVITVSVLIVTLVLAALQIASLMATRLRYERALSREAATLEAIVDAIPALVGVCDTDLRLQLVNRAYRNWRGAPSKDLVGRNLRDMLSAAEFERSHAWIQRALAGETVSFEIERPLDAQVRHLSVTCFPLRLDDGTVGGFIGMAEDITQHREENMRLLLLAERDPLTGLLNKAGFESYLGKQMAQGGGDTLAVLYIDLDHFKPINDTHGHTTGDEVLRQFAVRLHSVVRPTDAVARLGGDEFAVVLAGILEAEAAGVVADKIVELARQPIQVGDLVLNIGASVGAAANANAAGGWKGLVARADAMCYRAKAAGRGRRALSP